MVYVLQIILMSATFDTKKFAEYFAIPVRGVLEPAPIVSVEGRQYQVSEYYIEDLKPLGLVRIKKKILWIVF